MNELLAMDYMKMALRNQICAQCHWQHGPAAQRLDPAPRSCEARCALFVHLPRLARFITTSGGEPPWGYQAVVETLVRQTRIMAADNTTPALSNLEDRALCAYAAEALALLEHVIALTDPTGS